jgi:hypothetical protein
VAFDGAGGATSPRTLSRIPASESVAISVSIFERASANCMVFRQQNMGSGLVRNYGVLRSPVRCGAVAES